MASVTAPSVNPAGNTAVFNVIPTTAPQDARRPRPGRQPAHRRAADVKAPTYVVGTDAGYVDFTAKVAARMLWLILAVVALSLVLLTVAFRSIVIALKAAVLNLLSVGAAYGVIVAIFQCGWGSSLLGIDQTCRSRRSCRC